MQKNLAGLILVVRVPKVRLGEHPSVERENTDCNVTNFSSDLRYQHCIYIVESSEEVTHFALRRIDRALINFFRRCKEKANKLGDPRIKPRHSKKSFDCPEVGFRIRESGNRLANLIKGLKPCIVG